MDWILKGDHNLKLIRLHKKHGFSYDAYPQGFKCTLTQVADSKATLSAYPTTKLASKSMASAYMVSNLLRSEDDIDRNFSLSLAYTDAHTTSHKPMDLAHYIFYTTFDVVGEVAFS
ncbi:hypothetical protein CFE70_000942 [Pyrenophora teres f. teres 0-1]